MKREPLVIGRVLKPQALKGEMKLKTEARDINIFRELPFVYLKVGANFVQYEVESGRVYKNFGFLKLKGIDSPEAVEKLRGEYVYAAREHASPIQEGENYIADMIGIEVVGDKGTKYGKLTDILQNGAADVYCVKGNKGSFMFPSIKSVVLETDTDGGVLLVSEEHLAEVALFD